MRVHHFSDEERQVILQLDRRHYWREMRIYIIISTLVIVATPFLLFMMTNMIDADRFLLDRLSFYVNVLLVAGGVFVGFFVIYGKYFTRRTKRLLNSSCALVKDEDGLPFIFNDNYHFTTRRSGAPATIPNDEIITLIVDEDFSSVFINSSHVSFSDAAPRSKKAFAIVPFKKSVGGVRCRTADKKSSGQGLPS